MVVGLMMVMTVVDCFEGGRNRPKKRENSFIGLTPLIMKTSVSNIVSVKCRSNDMMRILYHRCYFVTTHSL